MWQGDMVILILDKTKNARLEYGKDNKVKLLAKSQKDIIWSYAPAVTG